MKPGHLNVGPDHLSRIVSGEEPTILEEGSLDVKLFVVSVADNQFADIIYFLTTGTSPKWFLCRKIRNWWFVWLTFL